MSKYFRDLAKSLQDDYTNIVEDGLASSEFTGTIDTGSYVLNAALSGSIYGGMPNNKSLALAGETTTGKTFFALGMMKPWLDANPNAGVVYFDTEAAVSKKMMRDRGIDTSRIIGSEPESVEKFRTKAVQILDRYAETPKDERPPMFFVLDSLGNLSTSKEIGDIAEGKETRDMTRAQMIRGAFRVIRLKTAKLQVPMIITNHTYSGMSQYSPKEISGGGGLKYASDQIAMLSKSKDEEDGERKGNFIRVHLVKSRVTRENSIVRVRLSYDTGLDRYYGLLDLAEEAGIYKKVSTRYELPDGSKQFGKAINADPEKYFTKDVLDKIDKFCAKKFLYGVGEESEKEDVEVEENKKKGKRKKTSDRDQE